MKQFKRNDCENKAKNFNTFFFTFSFCFRLLSQIFYRKSSAAVLESLSVTTNNSSFERYVIVIPLYVSCN